MKYSDRVAVLNSPIPSNAYGRNLTSTECKALRNHGVSCSESWIVSRAYDSPYDGILYYPAKGGGYTHANTYITAK